MSAPAPSPPSSSLRKLQAILQHHSALSTRKTDLFLVRVTKLLSTPSGIDVSLATLGYSLTLLHSYLHHRLDKKLTVLAEAVAEKAQDALLPGETLIATIPSPPECAALARRTESVKKLADLISDYRIFVRLWGLLGVYVWGRATWLEPPKDTTIKVVTWAQVAVNAAYQFLENGAYLAQHGILNGERWTGDEGAKRQLNWWLWSSKFWAAHVVLELYRLGYLVYKENKESKETREKAEDEGEVDGKEIKIAKENAARKWWVDLVRNAAYAPMTIHWSLEEGLISNAWVGFLGTVAGTAGLRELWKTTI